MLPEAAVQSLEMSDLKRQIPSGPTERYDSSEDLLRWMTDNFVKFGDIYSATISGSLAYVVGDPRYADHILRENWQNYKKGDSTKRIAFLLGNGLMVSEGEFWKRQRRLIQPAFHNKAVAPAIDIIISANTALLEKWLLAARNKSSVNVTRDVSNMVLEVTLRYLFGSDYEQVKPHFEILCSEPTRDLRFMQQFRPLRSVVSEIMSERREGKCDSRDVLGMLMSVRDREDGCAMPDSQIVSEIMTLIVAGHETTAATLAWVWHLLSEHPEVDERVSAELDRFGVSNVSFDDLPKYIYTRQVIEEALRLYPPGWLLIRKALKDDYLGNYFVPAGTEIYISPYLIHRNPSLWSRPNDFDPDRFTAQESHAWTPAGSIPFSAGPRKCIGEMLARVEMQLHVMTLASRLRLRQISGDPTKLEAGVNLRCKDEFVMVPEERATAFGVS
jgi:cytochrome P450